MASMKREFASTQEQQHPKSKRAKNVLEGFSSLDQQNLRVVLNPADCNLDFNIDNDGVTGHALYEKGFAYCWSGARGNIGITGGKYYFGCKIVSDQCVDMEDTPHDQRNVCRIGISRGDDPVGNLGETEHSYGYGGTRKFSNAGKFSGYGERFGTGDTIVCLVDLENKPCGTIEFLKNGKRLGIAKEIDAGPNGLGVIGSSARKLPWESALFPHVLLKNTVVQMQFSMEEGLLPVEGYKPWISALIDGKAITGPSFSDPTDCEVIMMVGLPASGKTTWAEKQMKEHPEKRYVLLGTNLALEQMKVPGLLRKNNYGERFDRLMDYATGIFNTLVSRASKVPRNYILDQTNVYMSARKRKLKPFAFYRKIAVVVFPRSPQLLLRIKKRCQEMGKEVPLEAFNEMLANFVLPMSKDMHNTEEYFDEIVFPELNRAEAQQHLDDMKRALALMSTARSVGHRAPPHSRESAVNPDSRISMNSLPGPGLTYSAYSSPTLGVQAASQGESWIGRPVPAVQPYPTNVNTGYAGHGQPGRIEQLQPYPVNVNTGYGIPGQPGRVDSFAGLYQGTYNTTYSPEFSLFMNTSGDARAAAYRPPHDSAYPNPPNPNPNVQRPGGGAPYGPPPPRYY